MAYPAFIPAGDGFSSLGFRFDGGGGGFDGAIDEVAFYNRALSPAQIQAHYNATVNLGFAQIGNNLVLTWPLGTLQKADRAVGSTFVDLPAATSPYTNAITGPAQFYRVRVQ
jgi:hypothetical protein